MATKQLTDVNTLVNVPVDEMVATIDVDEPSRLPTPIELYDRWERQHWTVQELDFSLDREHWLAMSPEMQGRRRRSFIGFLHGEVAVTETLHPYAIAAPRQDQRVFLTTQIVDEARHAVFFQRVFTEVCGMEAATLEEILTETKKSLAPTFNQIFDVELVEASQRIAREPNNLSVLTEGIVIYHLLIENMLAVSAQRSMLANYREHNVLPTFRAGFTAVTRDESRHILFGIGFLRDAIKSDPRQADVINACLDRLMPLFIESCTTPADQRAAVLALGIDPDERLRFAKLSLRKKLRILNLPIHPLAVA